MSRFSGQFSHSIDSKGRVSIPAKFRDVLREYYEDDKQLVVTLDEGFLVIYPRKEWAERINSIEQMSSLDNYVEDYKRNILSTAQDCAIDPQGRILVPPELRERAALREKVLYVGMIEYFEIWDRNAFLEQCARATPKLRETKQLVSQELKRMKSEQEKRMKLEQEPR